MFLFMVCVFFFVFTCCQLTIHIIFNLNCSRSLLFQHCKSIIITCLQLCSALSSGLLIDLLAREKKVWLCYSDPEIACNCYSCRVRPREC